MDLIYVTPFNKEALSEHQVALQPNLGVTLPNVVYRERLLPQPNVD